MIKKSAPQLQDVTKKVTESILYYRRARGDMIEAYKHVKGTYSIDTPDIKLEDTGSRGHEFKLKKQRGQLRLFRGLIGRALDHRPLPPEFESRRRHI